MLPNTGNSTSQDPYVPQLHSTVEYLTLSMKGDSRIRCVFRCQIKLDVVDPASIVVIVQTLHLAVL